MSFTEAQQFSHFEAESNKGTAEKAADGTEVGTPDSQKLDTVENDQKNEKNERPLISPEEYKKKNRDVIARVEKAKNENPDWPPAKGNPEAEDKLAGDLEAGMNNI